MASLFSELKRRNVFKVGVTYLVVGWIVVQGMPQMMLDCIRIDERLRA